MSANATEIRAQSINPALRERGVGGANSTRAANPTAAEIDNNRRRWRAALSQPRPCQRDTQCG
jgi:hypothetical protein